MPGSRKAGGLRGIPGLPKARRLDAVTISEVLKQYIKAYFISHAHLDHVAGLIINSPEDGPKPIYGLASCLDVLKGEVFYLGGLG